MQNATGNIDQKPNWQETFDRQQHFLFVNTSLYKVEQYLHLFQIANQSSLLTDNYNRSFGSMYLVCTPARCWSILFEGSTFAENCEKIKLYLKSEFFAQNHIWRSGVKPQKLRQTGSVCKYVSECRNLMLCIPVVSKGQIFDRFKEGFKLKFRLEYTSTVVFQFQETLRWL